MTSALEVLAVLAASAVLGAAVVAWDRWSQRRDLRIAHEETAREFHARGIPVPGCSCDKCKAARVARYGDAT